MRITLSSVISPGAGLKMGHLQVGQKGSRSSGLSDPIVLALPFSVLVACDFILSNGNSHMGSIRESEVFARELRDFESEPGLGNVLTLNQLCDLWATLNVHCIFQVP